MLAKDHKIKKKDFTYIFKKGQKVNFSWFGLSFLPSNDRQNYFSVIIPAKCVRLTSKRNFLKRKIYNLAKPHILANSPQSYRIIVRVFNQPNPENLDEGLKKLEAYFQKLLV